MSRKPKVLIVEDDRLLLKAMKLQFDKAGFIVKTAADGNEALTTLKTWIPSAVVLDILMPKKGGYEVLKTIKASPNLKGIPVIIASNLSQEKDRLKGMELSAAEFFVKSDLNLDDLIKKTGYHVSVSSHGRQTTNG